MKFRGFPAEAREAVTAQRAGRQLVFEAGGEAGTGHFAHSCRSVRLRKASERIIRMEFAQIRYLPTWLHYIAASNFKIFRTEIR